jgi:iron complex outermembrane receptor protein
VAVGAVKMKSNLIQEMGSLGLLLVVMGSLVKPAYAEKLEEIPHFQNRALYSSSTEQLLAQKNTVNNITGVKVNPTDKGIEVILESANAENLQPQNISQANNFIVDIPNTNLVLKEGKNFNLSNPANGIVSVSVNQINNNTTRLIVTGKDGLPKVDVFDDEQGLIFEFTPHTTANATSNPKSTIAQITDIKLNPTNTGTELILVTQVADKLQVVSRPDGKTFTIDIPGAQIANNNFRSLQPTKGISEILAINIDANTIRLSITGEANIPKVELFEDDAGLIFNIVPSTSPAANQKPAESTNNILQNNK